MSSRNLSARIAVISGASDEGFIVRKLLNSYILAGYTVKFLGWDRLRQKPKHAVVDGVDSEHIMHGWGFANWRLVFGLPIWMLRLMLRCMTLQTDLIHVLDFDCGFPVAVIGWLRGIPFVYDIQDGFGQRHHWPFPLNLIIRYLDGWVAKQASGILVPDENRITDFLEKHKNKILVIPNCAPDVYSPSLFQGAGSVVSSAAVKPFTVMALGNLSERRGIGLLLEATKRFPDIRVLMAGQFVEPALREVALSIPQVDFRGWLPVEQALQLGHQADVIFAFYDPSIEINRRASSSKWGDSMMLAKPILANRELMKASWIEQQGIGFLCSYGSVDELVKCLQYIKEHPEEAEERGRRGRVLYESEFNWPVMEKKILQMAQDILTPRGDCAGAGRKTGK